MKTFAIKLFMFFFIFAVIVIIGLLLPVTPRASKSLLFAQISKDSLLAHVAAPRVIFVGGSNLSFGLNSQMIKDSLNLNPINTGIHMSIGLKYMIDNTLTNVRAGDFVIISPEYQHFYDRFAYGEEELLITVMDVAPYNKLILGYNQWRNLFSRIPKYSFSKFFPGEYFGYSENTNYGISSFNKYGDSFTHWKLKKEEFQPFKSLGTDFNYSILSDLIDFKNKIHKRGAFLFITFPGYDYESYENCKQHILMVENELHDNGFILLGSAERYKIPTHLMYNTPYHLAKKGVDYRTNLLVNDIKKILSKY